MILDPVWRRFLAAVLLSAGLHAGLAVAPYLGMTTSASRPAVHGPHDAGRAATLRATLMQAPLPPAQVAENSATGTNEADQQAATADGAIAQAAPEPSMGIDVLPIPAPAYYTSDQLTRRPKPLAAPKLEVPPQLAPSFDSGKVILKLWINELGAVTSTEVELSEVPEAVSALAAAAFAKLRFVPGEINGRPVGVMMRIEVTYDDLKPPQ